MALLEVKGLEVYYGVIQALKGISFEVGNGEIVTLIGANGAGKTTLVNLITRFYDTARGMVLVDRVNVRNIDKAHLRRAGDY